MPSEVKLTAHEIIDIIESVAPLSQQEGWDNSGLQVGQRETEVARVLLCTDIDEKIIEEAVAKDCQMVISHHPLLFRGLKRIEGITRPERCVIKAIKNNIVLYSSHTAMDTYLYGVSGRMAEKLGIKDYKILSVSSPKKVDDEVLPVGLGVIGYLPEKMTLYAFFDLLKAAFGVTAIRYVEKSFTDGSDNLVQKVALCGGAGVELTEQAIAQSADIYVTADVKYHDMQAVEGRINLCDIGHFESEQYTKEIFAELLSNYNIDCVMAENDVNLVKTY